MNIIVGESGIYGSFQNVSSAGKPLLGDPETKVAYLAKLQLTGRQPVDKTENLELYRKLTDRIYRISF